MLKLKRTNVKVTSADTSSLKVEGILKYPLSFSDQAKSTTLTFNSFIVIKGLANSMNIGKPVLDAIGATWDFSAPNININGQLIDLVENSEDENHGSVCQIKHLEDKDRKINLYAKETIFVEPNSVTHVQLKFQKHNDDKLQDHVCIVPDEKFTHTKKLFMIPLTVARKDFLVTTIINTLDSGITIKRNQIVAQASNPSKDINEILTSAEHSQSSDTQETSQDSKSKHHIDTINNRHQHSADSKHHDVPIAERSAYLKSKLKIDQNPLLEEGDRKQRLLKILLQHWDVFDYYNERIPSARTDIKHHIETGDTPPIKSKCRPLNPIIGEKVKERLDNLEHRGIIRKSSSPWASPILVVAKGENDFRLVADYRRINESIMGNAWTIPNIETSLANLANQKFYSSLDLKEAFYGVELTKDSIPKSAIITPWGLYEYLRSNFGLKDAMNVYCRMISSVLNNMKSDEVINYVDDSIILGKDFDGHLKNLDKALEAFEKAGLILNIEKCKLVNQEAEFLGQVITPEGIKPIRRHIDTILNIPNPKNLKQLRSLIGKFNYYAKFIKNHAAIIAPLSELTKGHSEHPKNVPITLTTKAMKAIDIMKRKLTNAPILGFPDFYSGKPFIVTTDASFVGLAYIISQEQDGKERILGYGSRKLSEAESRYHINKLELLSVVTCLEKNKFLLYPKEFILRVDNKSLCYMKNLSPPGRLVERLLYILSNYNFTIEHKRSGEIVHVDYLSRDGCTGNPSAEELQMEKDTKDITISSIIIQQGNLNSIAWKEEQEKDEELKTVKQWMDNGTAPTRDELKSKSMKLQRLGKLFESIVIEPRSNALAIKTAEFEHPEIDKYRIIVPDHLEQDVIRRFHKSPQEGHFATQVTANKVLNHFWITTPIATVTRYITQCLECQLKKKSIIHKIKPQRSIMFTNKTNYPMALLYIDHYGKLPKSDRGNEYVLTCRDNFTRFVWLIPVKDTKSDTVVQALEENIFKYFGLVDAIISDNARSFTSNIIKDICKKLNIDDKHTIPYCPNPNQSERVHKNLGEILRALISDNQASWDDYLAAITLAFNCAKSRATNFSPYYLMFLRSPRIELDILDSSKTPGQEEDEYVNESLEKLQKVFNIVERQIKKNLDYRIKEYTLAKHNYDIGQHVLIFNPARKVGEASKLKRGWSLPFIITKKINDICFEMESLDWANPKFKVVRSISHMKPYHGPTEFKKVKNRINPIDFTSKHQYELIEEDDVDILDTNRRSSQPEDSQERIRLPSGNWILRNRISGEQSDTLQFDEFTREEENDEIIAPDIQNSALNEGNEESLAQEQQSQEAENDFPEDQEAAEIEESCEAPKCQKPKGVHSKHINCIHCGCAFHIRCVGFTERRAINESYICAKCERML